MTGYRWRGGAGPGRAVAARAMMVLRLIGWLLLGAALLCAGGEALASLQAGQWAPTAAGELWFRLDPSSLNLSQAVIQRYVAPWLWDPAIVTVLLAPAWVVLGLPGLLLSRLCRGARGRRRWFRR
jgi:hypothetical protein